MSSPARRVSFALGEDGVARVTLVAAARRNAIDPLWVAEFDAAIRRCADEPGVRAVLITAEGPTFCVGGDLEHFESRGADLRAALGEMVPPFAVTLGDLAHLPVPVVAAIQGPIAGGALGIAWAADLVLADTDARFAAGFDRLALSGDGGSSWWLGHLVGLRRAQEMLIGGRVVDAATALDWGLITEVHAPEDLTARAETLATRLAAGPTYAYGRMRRLLQGAVTTPLRDHLLLEAAAIVDCGTTEDAREGVAAFIEKRAPRFNGGQADAAATAPGASVPSSPRPLVEAVYAALGVGDDAALEAVLSPDFIAEFAAGMPAGGGRAEGAREAIAHWWAIGAEWAVRAVPQAWIACADGRLLVTGRYEGARHGGDGTSIDAAFTHLWTADGGRLTALAQVTDTARWV